MKRVPVIEEPAPKQREEIMEFVGKVTEIQQMPSVEDDWFVLLALPLREPSFVPSGTPDFLLVILSGCFFLFACLPY